MRTSSPSSVIRYHFFCVEESVAGTGKNASERDIELWHDRDRSARPLESEHCVHWDHELNQNEYDEAVLKRRWKGGLLERA